MVGRVPRAVAFATVLLLAGTGSAQQAPGARVDFGTDFQNDFVAATWIANGLPMESLDHDTFVALGRSLGTTPDWVPPGAPAHTHPPPATALVRPMLPLGYRGATLAFFCLSIGGLVFLSQILVGVWRGASRLPSPREALPLTLGIGVWPPTIFNLEDGQWSLLASALVAAAWWSLSRGAPRAGAGWLAAAISIKTTPIVLWAYAAVRARRVAGLVALFSAGIAAVTLPYVGGLSAWRSFIASGPAAIRVFEGLPQNTASVRGVFVRMFVPNRYIEPVFDKPEVGHAMAAASTLALVAVALLLSIRRARAIPARDVDPPMFAMWAALPPLLNPLAWGHNLLFLLLPMALLARDAGRQRRLILGAALFLLSVPTTALFQLAGPPPGPFPASRAWILGLHALAGLIVFFTGCAATARLGPTARTSAAEPLGATAPGQNLAIG